MAAVGRDIVPEPDPSMVSQNPPTLIATSS